MKRAALVAMVTLGACEGVMPGIDWQQMNDQHKYLPYSTATYFADGRTMRPLPAGTVAHDAITGQPGLTEGVVEGAYVTRIPLAVTRALLEKGRSAFSTYCAACHGLTGDGASLVAEHMELRAPPSLLSREIREAPPGRVFQIASLGYGLMPSYAAELSTTERWATVAYLGALQLSQEARLDDLPLALRRETLAHLGAAP